MAKCDICIEVKHPVLENWSAVELRSQPDFSTTYGLVDILKTNKSVSFFSINVDMIGSKSNVSKLLYSGHETNIESLIGIELDARVYYNNARIDLSDSKLTITDVKYKKGQIDIFTARLVGSRYLWLNDIKDKKLCSLSSIFDNFTFSDSNVQASWDKSTWTWRSGWAAPIVHYGLWRNEGTVSYQDVRPSANVKYLLTKSIEELTRFKLKSQFFDTELFEGLYLLFTRGDWGVPLEYRNRNNFVVSKYPDSAGIVNQFDFPTVTVDNTVQPYDQFYDNRIVSTYDKVYSGNNNKNEAGNFNTIDGTFSVPPSASQFGGLNVQFLVDIGWNWINRQDNEIVLGVTKYNKDNPGEASDISVADDTMFLAAYDDADKIVNLGASKARIRFRLLRADSAGNIIGDPVDDALLLSEWFRIEPQTDKTVTSYTAISDNVCLDVGDQVYLVYDIEDSRRIHLATTPSGWGSFIGTFTGGLTGQTKIGSYIEFNTTNLACYISEDICGDYELNIADIVDCDLTVKKLIDGLTGMFNLVWSTDPSTRTITVEPDPEFFKYGGPFDDWSSYIDCESDFTIKSEQASSKCKKLVYREDTADGYIQKIEEQSGFRFAGQRDCVQNAELFSEELIVNAAFSPTYFIQDTSVISIDESDSTTALYVKPPIFPRIWDNYVSDELRYLNFEQESFELRQEELETNKYDWSPRIVYFQGITNYTKPNDTPALPDYEVRWKYNNVEQLGWPYAFMVDAYNLKNYSLSFSNSGDFINITDVDFFSNNAVSIDNFNIFTNYWEDYLSNDMNALTFTGKVILNNNDLDALNFRRLKWFRGVPWKLGAISNYNHCNSVGALKMRVGPNVGYKYVNTPVDVFTAKISLGGYQSGTVIDGADASKYSFSDHQLVLGGEIRRNDNNQLIPATSNYQIVFDIQHNGDAVNQQTGEVVFDYGGDVNLLTTVPSSGVAVWNDILPYIITGSSISGGKINLILDKRSWAINNTVYSSWNGADEAIPLTVTATVRVNGVDHSSSTAQFGTCLETPVYQAPKPVFVANPTQSEIQVDRQNDTSWETNTAITYIRQDVNLAADGYINGAVVATDNTPTDPTGSQLMGLDDAETIVVSYLENSFTGVPTFLQSFLTTYDSGVYSRAGYFYDVSVNNYSPCNVVEMVFTNEVVNEAGNTFMSELEVDEIIELTPTTEAFMPNLPAYGAFNGVSGSFPSTSSYIIKEYGSHQIWIRLTMKNTTTGYTYEMGIRFQVRVGKY